MNLQEQTCTREQGARLVELGVKPQATFYHMPAKDGPHGEWIRYTWHGDALAPAYNAAELEDMMDDITAIQRMADGDWWARLGSGKIEIDNPTGAQARAAYIIYRLENKLLQLPDRWQTTAEDNCITGTCSRVYSPDYKELHPLPIPTDEERQMSVFAAVWKTIQHWQIKAPEYYNGTLDALGGHVKVIVDAIRKIQ